MTLTPNKTEAFDAVDIIRIKRDKGVLSPEQIDWTIDAYTRGAIADEQMAALNMAILLNGMDRAEISRWTAAMIASGERMDFSALRRPDGGVKATSDKHSTGGVGDKITLPLAPLVAVDVDGVERLRFLWQEIHGVSSRFSGPIASGSTWSMVLSPCVVMSSIPGARNS